MRASLYACHSNAIQAQPRTATGVDGGQFVRPWSSPDDVPLEKGILARWGKSGSIAVAGGEPPALTAKPRASVRLSLSAPEGQDQRQPDTPGRPAGHPVPGAVQQVDLQTLGGPLASDQCASDTIRWQRHAHDILVVSPDRALRGSGGKVHSFMWTFIGGFRASRFVVFDWADSRPIRNRNHGGRQRRAQ